MPYHFVCYEEQNDMSSGYHIEITITLERYQN